MNVKMQANIIKLIIEIFKFRQRNLMENQFQHCIIREEQSKIFKQPTLIYPVTLQELLNDRYPQDPVRAEWTHAAILNLRRFKEVIVSYGIHLPFVKQMLNSWLVCNRIIPKDWIELVKGVLEPGPQLQWSTWFREEANTTE